VSPAALGNTHHCFVGNFHSRWVYIPRGSFMTDKFGAGMTALVWFKTHAESSADGFLVADRYLSVWHGAFSIAVSWIWASAIFICSLQAYTKGLPGMIGVHKQSRELGAGKIMQRSTYNNSTFARGTITSWPESSLACNTLTTAPLGIFTG